MADRDRLLFDLCMALRQVPAGILRDLGKGRLPGDELAEKIVAERILEHLQLCGWRLEHHPGRTVTHPGRSPGLSPPSCRRRAPGRPCPK